jgi:CheY-like chemotaxis protein
MERKPPMAATKPKNISPSDLEQFAKTLRELKEQVSALNATENAELRQEFLNELYVGINLLRSDAARAGLRAVCELSSALGKLISKLLDKPTLHTPSTIGAISAAIQLLDELAQGGVEHDLVNPPVRALVVDDEPLARRAISNALQLTISKPDTAENGQAALALTQSKTFDVIFLDIMMPEVDGFETCLKIRRTNLNTATPIVFVTSSTDIQSRDKAFDCGGNGFISKPVLPAEIFLTALTYTLRARIGKGAPAEVLEEAVC